ncbi:hypothetical protein JCM11491_000707, partial [Sporobolomyces phaffii]
PIEAVTHSLSTALSPPFVSHPPCYSHPPLQHAFVSRQEYHEAGSNACRRKFARFYWTPAALDQELAAQG